MRQPRRLTILLVAVVALAAAVAGAVVGAKENDEQPGEPPPERAWRPLDRTSFLARIIPAQQEERPAPRGPNVPRSVADLARRLPLERKVAQLFLFGFEGTDLTAEIYRRLRRQDLGAIEAGAPGVLLSHALYPVSDFTRPGSLTRAIATDLLRSELRFQGVAITDDLADPAITSSYSVPDAAVQALKAGADVLFICGPAGDQQAAYASVLGAVRSGDVPPRRLNDALLRSLEAKEDNGLIR